MKTFEEIVNQKPVFINDFKNSSDVEREFEVKLTDEKILFASYGNANYSGNAWVLFAKGGKLFEVNGSHCSCHGLEDQWDPEEVLLIEMKNRLTNGSFGKDDWSDNYFHPEICKFLGLI